MPRVADEMRGDRIDLATRMPLAILHGCKKIYAIRWHTRDFKREISIA